jgi:hypothetical protein
VNGQRPLEAIPYWLGHPPVPSSAAPEPRSPVPPRRAPDWAPIRPTSSFDRAPATEDCRDFADQGPCCWAWSDNTRSWVLMGRWGLWGSPNTLWVPWWAIDLPCGWGEWQP